MGANSRGGGLIRGWVAKSRIYGIYYNEKEK